MLPVVGTEQAEIDLAQILDYLAAERLATTRDERCQLLGHFPDMGRARDELAPGLRSVVIEKHIVFYRATASAIEVVRILHTSRDVQNIMRNGGSE